MTTPQLRFLRSPTSRRPSLATPLEPLSRNFAPRAESTILLVDDDPAVLEALGRVLKTEGWTIVSAASGEEALEYMQSHQPALMITDLSMAAVSGWDLLFHERLQRPKLPIFVITALPLSATGGAEKFADEFFQKPLELDLLLSAVRREIGVSRPIAAAVRSLERPADSRGQ